MFRFSFFVFCLLSVQVKANPLIGFTRKTEQEGQIPPHLLVSIISVESTFDISLNSLSVLRSGTQNFGLGQISPLTARRFCNLNRFELLNSKKNILCASIILKRDLIRYRGNIRRAVAAYNAGTPCECDGVNFVRLDARRKICFSSEFRFKRCKRGRFLNQKYVDAVMGVYLH